MLACAAAVAAAGCQDAESVEVQPLPPLERPSLEARAGLPEVAGTWRFAGFEIPPRDTANVRMGVWPMTPPGDLAIETQRLDSIAGRYVREGTAFPLFGEVRRDSTFALVAFAGGEGSFAAGRVRADTLWIELTSFSTAGSWPRGTRAGLVRRPSGEPFLRLVGGSPITEPVDSVALADSIRLDSLRRAGELPPAEGAPPAAVPPQQPPAQPAEPRPQPRTEPAEPRPQQPQQPQQPRPRQPEPAPREEPQRPPPREPDTPRRPAPQEPDTPPRPQPEPVRPTPAPPPAQPTPPPAPPGEPPAGPRDTIRFGVPGG